MRHIWVLLFVLFALPAWAGSPVPPQVVVDAAMALYFDYDYADPDNAWAPRPAPDQVKRFLQQKVLLPVHFSGQAAPDWMIDVEADPTAAWCGTGGCALQIWTADKNGAYHKVFDQQVRDWKLKPIKGERRRWLWVDLHGSACGSFGADACPFAFEWSPHGQVSASGRFASAPVLRPGPLPQALDHESRPVGAPSDVLALADRQQAVCASAGGDLNGAFRTINHTPDLNGDGVDDWSLDAAGVYCTFLDDIDFAKSRAFDACGAFDCIDQIFLSNQTAQGVAWRRVPLGAGGYVFRITKLGFELLQMEPLPGHEPETDQPCSAEYLDICQFIPVDLSSGQ